MADVKEYLQRATTLNGEIDCKLDQVSALRAIATKATTTLSNDPKGGSYNNHSMESVIVKIMDLEAEINREIDKLIDLKREIGAAIGAVKKPKQRELLERKYLCFKTWEQIAVDMNYDIRRVYQIHGEALNEIRLQ